MREGLFFVFAGLLVLAAGVSAIAGVSVDAGATTGLVISGDASAGASAGASTDASADSGASASVAADATASATPSVTPTASPTPSVPPIKSRVGKAQEKRVIIAASVKDRIQDIKENVKDRVQDVRNNTKERIQDVRENTKDRVQAARENGREKMREVVDARQKAVRDAREAELELAEKVKALKAKDVLNESERDDLRKKTRLHLMASYHHRIELAKKMQAEGANATLVADFVVFAEANWNLYDNATNNSVRKDLITQFNHAWRAFKQAVTKDLLVRKLHASVDASRQTLARLDAVIAKLTAGGFNTTALVNATAAISARLDSVLLEPDVPHAIARLRQAHSGLVHLRNAIQRTVNRELVEAYREPPAPSVAADATLSITGSLDASPAATAGTSASELPPTAAAASAAGSSGAAIGVS